MKEYKRSTKYNEYNHNAEVYAYTVGKEDIYFDGVDIVGNENSSLAQETIDKLALLEDKIENGTLIEPKYPLYSIVFIIDYINEKGYSVYGGKPIVRECFVTSITQMLKEERKLLYRVQPKNLPNDVLEGEVELCEYWERSWWEKDLFLTKAEAEKKLKELKNE